MSVLDHHRISVDAMRWPDVSALPEGGLRTRVARRLFHRVVARLPLNVVLPGGRVLGTGGPGAPVMTLLKPEALYARVGATGLIGFGESYMAGDWEADDLTGVLTIFAERISTLVPPRLQRLRTLALLSHPSHHRNEPDDVRSNISRHYDLSNDLFALFLDPTMTYSAALFDEATTLHTAQQRKVDRLLDALHVTVGTELLEIGTGWGELALRAARRGARVRSITLSEEQRVLAMQRIDDAGVADRVQVDLCDYRDVEGTHDAVVSVEMIEAVGYRYWPTYFDVLARAVKPGGRIGLQAITLPHDRMLASRDTFTWIQKYIFPGGQIPSLEAIVDEARVAGLAVVDDLAFGADYARTLNVWRARFEDRAEDVALLGFDPVFQRMWSLYLAYSEAGFRSGYLDVIQFGMEKQ